MTPSRRRKKKSSSSKTGPARRRRPDRSRSIIPTRTAAAVEAPTPAGQIQIDLGALRRNASALKSLIGPACELLAVVKADGYGHGMIEVARAALAGGATRLGVTTVAEGLALREAGLGCPILVMGVMHEAEAPDAVAHRLTPVICRDSQLEALAGAVRALTRKPAAIHLKADTGMGRLGLPPEESLPLLERAWSRPELRVEGIMTHFAEADAAESAYTTEQLDRFRALLNRIAATRPDRPPRHMMLAHAANSAALLTRPESRLQMVRAGLALYGLLPSPSCRGIVELEPVMRWTSRIAHVRRFPSGRSLGYGRTFTTKRPSLIGLLPIGYAAGYSRLLSNQAFCLHQGGRAPVVGRISMDLTMIDLTDHPSAQIGDEVVLLGRQECDRITAEELAVWAQTIPYEITCSAGSRTTRRYVESPPNAAPGASNRSRRRG